MNEEDIEELMRDVREGSAEVERGAYSEGELWEPCLANVDGVRLSFAALRAAMLAEVREDMIFARVWRKLLMQVQMMCR